MRITLALALPLLAVAAVACGDESPTRPADGTPSGIAMAPNPRNALSGIVTFRADGADSARALYAAEGGSTAAAVTPFVTLREGAGRVVLLGLRPGVRYSVSVETVTGGVVRHSDPSPYTAGQLPEELRSVRIEATGARGGGYVVTTPIGTAIPYLLAFDGSGAVAWYRELREGGMVLDARQQPNGDFTAYVGLSQGFQPTFGAYVQFRPDGEEVRRIVTPPPFYTDGHELLLTFRDTSFEAAHLFGYTIRPVNATVSGVQLTKLAGHAIFRLDAAGLTRFYWDAWEHIAPSESVEPMFEGQYDFDHPNSLDIDPADGNYVVSWRNTAQVMKVDARNGAVIWRLGGTRGDLRFVDDPFGGFSAQHYARMLDNGNLLVFDNGTRHSPPQTRVVEYQLDLTARTARLVWEYRHSPSLYSSFVGSSQRLTNGNTVIGYGGLGRVVEVDRQRNVVWEGRLMVGATESAFYRAVRVPSLYRYERP